MLIDHSMPLLLAASAALIATALWVLLPRLRLRVHREQPNPGFLLYEICLMFDAGRFQTADGLQLSFYLSFKRA